MTDQEKIQYLLSVVREARQMALEGDCRRVWNALYLPAEIETTKVRYDRG